MRRILFYGLVLCLSLSVFFCTKKEPSEEKVIAKINDYPLTLDEFQYELASEMELDRNFKLTKEVKKRFLDQLIQKELLIQEAKRMKLDTREEFRKAIERYWESTLIKDLLELKGREIAKKTLVSEEEILRRYNQMLKQDPALPSLSKLRPQIENEIREEKKTKLLKEWMQDLRKKANIQINEDML